jgi:hypothetical protein
MNTEEQSEKEEIDTKEPSTRVYVGLDIGQSQDPTAIVVLQHVRSEKGDPMIVDEYRVRDAKRLQLGTSYVDVIRHVSGLLEAIRPLGNATLIMDATGVGAPIVDMFRAAGLKPVAVQVHGGQIASYDKGSWHIPKRDLVSSAKRLLGEKTLKIADGLQHGDTLITELQNFSVNINIATGHDSYEAWREGVHDDLVFALSLTCWWALRKKNDTLSIDASEVMTDTAEGAIRPWEDYYIGWVPARDEEYGALVVYNLKHSSVVHLERTKNEPMLQQIEKVFQTAQRYDAAVVAQAGTDESILNALDYRGAYVERIDLDPQKLTLAYENLSFLVNYKQIKLPNDPELLAELEIEQNSVVVALCLVTHDVYPDIGAKTHEFGDDDPYDRPMYYRDDYGNIVGGW